MAYELLLGLWVEDPARYADYRANMMPLFTKAGGRFRYDFEVAKTLKAENGERINRVMVIAFPDEDASKQLFANPDYLEVRKRYFEPSVTSVSQLSAYWT